MAYQNFKSQSQFNDNNRTVINNYHEAEPYHIRKYGAIININGKDVLEEYEGKFRSEAIEHFKEVARLNQGKFKQLVNFPRVRD